MSIILLNALVAVWGNAIQTVVPEAQAEAYAGDTYLVIPAAGSG